MKTDKALPSLSDLKSECCGCGVCSVICPSKAIMMVEDEEGFLYPRIDETICIGCMQCINVCSIKARRNEVRANFFSKNQ
ncbi:MAG: 4Fe-4S binding protein [Ruminococcus sp.]|nr:4Fe-4S binding protein [Candidatus Copronaster equi]